MKAYTDLPQSRTLAEFLPHDSADMHYVLIDTDENKYDVGLGEYIGILPNYPCWSLTALLDLLPYPTLSKDKIGADKTGWMLSVYPDNCRYDSCWHDNPIDACVDMAIKLNEQKLL